MSPNMILKYIVFTAFLTIISISCDKQYGSLTFVIDTTGSMKPEIQLVNDAANEIMEIILLKKSSQIKDVVLVTFNDPDYQHLIPEDDVSTKVVLRESRSINEVKRTLANLVIDYGGPDCVEYSLSGIKMGLSESKRNSYLFVFTDAPPKDGHVDGKLDWTKLKKEVADVNKLAQSRGSQVYFFLSQSYCQDMDAFTVYWDIAAATNGQVFILENKNDIALLIPFLEIVISGNADTMHRVVIPANEWGTVPFTVDDQTEYVVVSASSPGENIDLGITKSPTPTLNQNKISWTANNKILKIDNPAPGSYEAQVRGSSETTVMIIGRTDFTFQHGFSETVPPTFRNDKLQPTEGIKSSLLVKVMDPTHSVEIKTAQIVSADGKTVYYSLPLKKHSNDYYNTESFLPPDSMFLITIIGEGRKTYKEIKRTAKTPIQSRPRDTDPEVSIEGGGKYTYKSNVLLTCKVKAFPAPVITWRDDKGNVLPSLSTQKKDTYNYISKMTVPNLTHKSAYYCHAQVGVNENSDRVDLDVISPFIVDEDKSKASVTAEFENPAELKCNIKSKFSMEIVWYHISGTNRKVLKNSAEYKISSDGTQMTVNKMKPENEGKYVCEAGIRNDPTTTYQIERDIKIKHVAPIMGKADKVRVNENDSVDIKCNIMKAYPKPKVIWWFRSIESNSFIPLQQGDILKIAAASLSSAGVYKCYASNDQGSNSHETTVTVLTKPKVKLLVNNEEKSVANVEYNNNVQLSCHVISHSSPDIVWKNGRNEKLKQDRIISRHNEYTSYLTFPQIKRSEKYYCEATNELATMSKVVSVQVKSPFEENSTRNTSVIVEFESPAELKCNIKSKFSMEIVWYHISGTNRKILNNSAEYKISSDGTQMTVNKVKPENEGKYVCEARIRNDPTTKTYQIEGVIEIKQVAPIMRKADKVRVNENDSVDIKCNIMKAYPKPKVIWMFRSIESDSFRPLPEQGEILKIAAASLSSAGVYKCYASNDQGSNSHETTVTVLTKPKVKLLVNNEEKSVANIEYNNNVQLSCHVISHSSPDIVWRKNGRNEKLKQDRIISRHNEYTSYLTIPKIKRSDKYYCEATNELAKMSKVVSVQVKSPFEESSTQNNKFTPVKYGEDVSINCGITSHLPIRINWFRDTGEMISNSDKYSISPDGAVLKIKQVRLDSRGKYTCKASIVGDETMQETHDTTVDVVVEKPHIEKQPDVTVRRNQTAVLKCRVTKGLPRPTITWMVMNEKMNKFTALPEVGEELTVPFAQFHHAGSYKCKAINDIGEDEQIVKLFVEGPPQILSDEDKLYTALVGDVTLRIPCVTVGYPKPVISWTPESKKYSARKFSIDTDDSLFIKNPEVEDSGKYTCKATNKLGSVEKIFEGYVMEYIDLDQDIDTVGNTTYVDVLEGATKPLDCANGSLKGRWYKEGYPTNLTGLLTIDKATRSQEGNYTCRLSDNTGSKSHTYIVIVGKPPKFEDPNDENLDNWTGNDDLLSCAVSESMRPKIRTAKAEWKFNGKPSGLATGGCEQSLHPIVSWGQYTCTISNIHGSVTKHFNVHSTGCLMPVNSTVTRSPLVVDIAGTWPELSVTHKYLYMPHNQAVLLSCHNQSKPNLFEKIPKSSEIIATCDHEDKFVVGDSTYKITDLQCSAEVTPVVQATGEKCLDENSEILKVGFNVDQPQPHFLEVYSVCFDNSIKVPIYTKADIAQTNVLRLENASWKKYDKYYNEKNKEFCVGDSKCCVNKRQLVDQLDVVNGPAQWATFIEGLNTVPYWSGCENISDTLDELDIKIRSNIIKKPYTLLSGAYKYVDNNGTMVPRYLWKMVQTSTASIVYVRVNDPHPTAEDILCKKITRCPGWMPKGNFSYCCRRYEFTNFMPIRDA